MILGNSPCGVLTNRDSVARVARCMANAVSRIAKTMHLIALRMGPCIAFDARRKRSPDLVCDRSCSRRKVSRRMSCRRQARRARGLGFAISAALALRAGAASASFLSGEALDTAADVLTWIVIVIVPIVGITLFWLVHVLPEKIAERRHHPQTQAIHTLCLLSLVFGGMLWPIAWLWAFTRPVAYKLAYGTERSEGYFLEMGERARAGKLAPDELASLSAELDSMERQGAISAPLTLLRQEIARIASPVVEQERERRRA